jgi:hypothetical protein
MEEQKAEEKKDIVVLDEGISLTVEVGPDFVCCWGAFTPIRG